MTRTSDLRPPTCDRQLPTSILLRLVGFLTPYTSWMTLAVLFGLATVGSGIGLMAASAWIISSAALQPSIADLQVAIVGVRFFGIARGVFRYLERYVSHQVTFRLLARLRVWFYESIEPLAPARLMGRHSGDLLARIVGDIETLQNFYVRVIAPPVVAVLTGAVMWVLLGAFDLRVALAFLGVFAAMGLGVPLLARQLSRAASARLVTARAELTTTLVDGIQGAADLIAFGQAGAWVERLGRPGDALARAQARMASITGLQNALGSLLNSVAVLAVLIVAIPLVNTARIAGVNLAVLVLAAMASFEAVLPLPLAAQYLDSTLESARRLFELATTDGRPQTAASAWPGGRFDLAFSHVCFRYAPDEPPAVDDISFELTQGRRVAIVGPSGAGKSTLVNLLLRFWECDAGAITLGGRDVRSTAPDDVRRWMGVVSQSTYLFNATIRDNLLIAKPDATQAELDQAIQRARLEAFVQALPQGYDTWIGEQGMRLSGGERQRLAIARALLQNAPILILDEATANLDPATEREVMRSIRALMEGRTTLIVTHRLVGLEDADEILVLQAGRVAERGRHRALIQARGLYHRLWELQNQVLGAA